MRPQDADREHSPDLRDGAGDDQARTAARPRDAWRGAAALLLLPLLGGCAVPKELNPAEIYREVAGINDQRRLPPPGLDQPYRSLASVPPRPERPPAEARAAISDALAAARAASREPVLARGDAAAAAGPAPGELPLPAAPPPRPQLAAAPAIPWLDPPRPAAPRPPSGPGPAEPATPIRATPRPDAPPAPRPELPEAPPAPPPVELLAPPPPTPDLMAPPPARPR